MPVLHAGGFDTLSERRLETSTTPDIVALARQIGTADASLRGRAEGWAVLDIGHPPALGFGALGPEEAERINAFLPASIEAPSLAAPFFLKGPPAEQERALLCLTQAIYYEAALEPLAGQQAVAQTVINRVRNPAFPHSICGVVYQGSQQVTGCQFSFTCDGSRNRPPIAPYWQEAHAVARQATNGYVMKAVGTATHYHADYVFPNWGPTLVKIGQFGAQIFYRFPGPLGSPPSFRQPYGGGELRVSMAGPSPQAILAAAAAAAAAPGSPGAPAQFEIADPTAPQGLRKRVAGEIVFGRRIPTRDEISRINKVLAAMDQPEPGAPAPVFPYKSSSIPANNIPYKPSAEN
jgi:spore germination cell wall hydrolase CwlJ-like protein